MKIVIGVDCEKCKYHKMTYGSKSAPKVLCGVDDKSRTYGMFYDCHFFEEKNERFSRDMSQLCGDNVEKL